VMGGAMQPQGHVQVLCNLIDFGMNVQEAGDAARFRHLASSQPTGEKMRDGGYVALESGVPESVQRELAQRGHRVQQAPGGFGGYQAIMYDAKRDIRVPQGRPSRGVLDFAGRIRTRGVSLLLSSVLVRTVDPT